MFLRIAQQACVAGLVPGRRVLLGGLKPAPTLLGLNLFLSNGFGSGNPLHLQDPGFGGNGIAGCRGYWPMGGFS